MRGASLAETNAFVAVLEQRSFTKAAKQLGLSPPRVSDMVRSLEERLGVRRGETTPDGEFTLLPIECLASCGTAPVLQVNDAFVENVTLERADALVERLREEPRTAAGSRRTDDSERGAASQNGRRPAREA